MGGRGWHAARLALTWPNRLVRCYRFCCARAMGEWSPPINQQEEIGREATVEAPSAQTCKDYTSRPGALSRFFRMSRDGWKSKYKDLKATVKGYKNRPCPPDQEPRAVEDQSRESGRADHHPGSRDRRTDYGLLRARLAALEEGRSTKTRPLAELHRGSDPSRVRPSEDSILISLARPWGRASGVSRSGPDSVRAAPESSRRPAAGRYAHARGGLSTPLH